MLHGRLLDENAHSCESLSDLSYPVVLLQGVKSGSDRFIECLRGDLYGVLNVSKIFYRNCASSQNHGSKGIMFAVCSPDVILCYLGCLTLRFHFASGGSRDHFPFFRNTCRDMWMYCTSSMLAGPGP